MKMLMLALTLLISTALLQAQDQAPQGQSPQAAPQAEQPQDQAPTTDSSRMGSGQMGNQGSAQTVEGCLQNSNGNFTLTDSSGTMYQLQGDTSKLSAHVGHEVRVTGMTSSGSNTSSETTGAGSGMPSSSGAQPMLTVQKFKHVSKNCNSNGMVK